MIIVLRKDEVYELFSTIISNDREQLKGIPIFQYFCDLSASGDTIAMRISEVFPGRSWIDMSALENFTIDQTNQLILFSNISDFIKGMAELNEYATIYLQITPPMYMSLAPRVMRLIINAVDTDELMEDLSKLSC